MATAKLWVRLFRGKYEVNSLATVDKTHALIKSLVHVESKVGLGVSFPLQERPMEPERFPLPYHMLVSSLTAEQAEYLINLMVVSTKDITTLFLPFEDQRPSCVSTIYGLTFTNSQEARSAVTELVVDHIQESEQVMKHIVDCANKNANYVAIDILNSISVKFLEVKRSNVNGGNFRG